MWSSKMSLQSVKFNFQFSDWLYTLQSDFFTTEIVQSVPKIRAADRLQKTIGNKKWSALFGYILKSVFVSLTDFAWSHHFISFFNFFFVHLYVCEKTKCKNLQPAKLTLILIFLICKP